MKESDFADNMGWEFSAPIASQSMNLYKNVYSSLDKGRKVKLAHQFYDLIFRCNDIPIRFSSKESLPLSSPTADHPFSARVAHRAIMNDNQWLLDDFDVFKKEFYKLMQKINMTSKENSGVKILPDHNGDVKIPKFLIERYERVEKWYDKEKGTWTVGFPLEIPDWYAEYEISKVPNKVKSRKLFENHKGVGITILSKSRNLFAMAA